MIKIKNALLISKQLYYLLVNPSLCRILRKDVPKPLGRQKLKIKTCFYCTVNPVGFAGRVVSGAPPKVILKPGLATLLSFTTKK